VIHGLARSNLPERTRRVLKRGARRNPDVYLVEFEGGPVVVKDFTPRGAFVRAWIGPFLQRRELRAYERLAGHPAVPKLLGEIDRRAFAVEYRPGEHVSRKLRGRVSDSFVDELEEAIAAMHARGVAHLDLKHRSNVLVGEDGKPVLIDFASAVCLEPGSLVARLLLPILAWVDRRALEKWRVRLTPQPDSASATGSTVGSADGASGSGRGANRPT
jgi:predicted Ser/Thr protein kinase